MDGRRNRVVELMPLYLSGGARRGNRQQHVKKGCARNRAGALDRQQVTLGDGAAIGRDLVGVVARFQYAVAGHDDHERVLGDRLRHRQFGADAAHLGGDLVIGSGFATWNGAGEFVDPLTEERDALHVEDDVGEVGVAPTQKRGNALDGRLNRRRRSHLARFGIKAEQAAAGLELPRLWQLHADDPGIAPDDAATPYASVEDRVPTPHEATPSPPSAIITLS